MSWQDPGSDPAHSWADVTRFLEGRIAPGGKVVAPDALAAELEARAEDVLMVGEGAILYRDVLETPATRAVFAPAALAHPWASALVEVSVPRFIREETDRVTDVVPMYLRKTDAEIAWDHRARGSAPRG